MADSSVSIFDPEDVETVRIQGHAFQDGYDRIRLTYNVNFDGELVPVQIYHRTDDFASFLVACLNALGFPEGDLEYIAQRLIREDANAATQHTTDDA